MKQIKNDMNKINATLCGVALLLGWCIVSAIARIFTANTVQLYSPTLVCFYTFLITSVFYFLLCLLQSRQLFLAIKNNFFNVFMLNMSSFGGWFFLVYPLKVIQPSVVSTITLGLGPFSSILLGKIILKSWAANQSEKIISGIITVVILFLCGVCFFQKAGIVSLQTTDAEILMALGACLICGISTSINNLYAKKLAEKKVAPTQILALRFWLIAILSLIFEMTFSNHLPPFSFPLFLVMMKLAFLLVIIPLYLAQHGIKYLSPASVALIAPLMPILLALFEWHEKIILPLSLWVSMFAIMSCVFIFGIIQIFWRKR